jgi:restriction endonuclease Mrr
VRDREPRDRDGEARDRDGRRGDGRDRGADARTPLADLAGNPLADAIESLLSSFDRNRGPVALSTLVDAAQRRGRLNGDIGSAQALIVASARADNARRAAEGRRARFRVSSSKIALTDWQLDGDLGRAERELFHALERYREAARRSLLRNLQDLPHRSLGELIVLLLEHMGYVELTPVRRPGTHGAELHLSGRARGPLGEVRTAIIVRRDGREIGRERVTELRGALHHYGPAQAGLLITTGQVLSGAREEASAPGATQVAVIDGMTLARLCDEHAVGVSPLSLRLPLPDVELFDGLRGG